MIHTPGFQDRIEEGHCYAGTEKRGDENIVPGGIMLSRMDRKNRGFKLTAVVCMHLPL